MPTAHRATDRGRRTVLRAWAETRGLVGGQLVESRTVALHTSDGVALRGDLLAGPAGTDGTAVVLLHGFAARAGKPAYASLAADLARRHTVLAVDLRGHGRSAGRSGLGGAEAADVGAAVRYLRHHGHGWVGLVGVSMGGTAAANAVHAGVDVDALALVSAPGWLEDVPTTAPMRRLHRLWHSPVGRAGLRTALGVRVVRPVDWRRPVDPATAVAGWDGPLLVVHGDDDAYFPTDHPTALVQRTTGTSTLWLEPGFGHAEDGFGGDVGDRLASALARLAAGDGAGPATDPQEEQ